MKIDSNSDHIALEPLPIRKGFINRTGNRYGRWLVIGYGGRTADGNNSMWWCKCDCGTLRKIKDPQRGISCGCYQKEAASKANKTHGRWGSPLYWVWHGMMQRCHTESSVAYQNYGGRGIKVCERWHTFELFVQDMGDRPSKDHSLDRIDNSGDYEPGNVRWATGIEQANNTRRNRKFTFKGETLTVAQWARRTGLNYGVIRYRLDKGLPAEKILEV